MTERLLTWQDVELAVETFGSPNDPTVLLIAGGGQSMVWWEEEFCARLAGAGRQVIRYDHRDTGRSTSSPAGRPSYSPADLASDPVRILDALGVHQAHVVGLSMGGGIAQLVALTQRDRVATLTAISTSPAGPGAGDLPGPEPAVQATFTDPDPEPDWDDREAVVTYRVDVERPYAGALGFDEDRVRRLATLEVDRTGDMAASLTNHFVVGDHWPEGARLEELTVPTLVMHGTTDPLLPVAHGEALARAIPGATFVPLEGMGHQQPPPSLWDITLAAIARHTDGR
ncbi:alpha/beta fold hydrolase [Ornithinicoccus halotolerans]|uniref:alpha/beta fold hydrolase n=1 Tax=Ornithinicoccus halotolerans TaxID=1748220 RepID=UPI0012973392|nr:alpha/beta fold hydrolase [Ornithinicoccus halotolerans]